MSKSQTYKVGNFEFNNQEDAGKFNSYSGIFTDEQLREIYLGYKNKIDYTVYAKEEFDEFQMAEIRFGLEKKLDVSSYSNTTIDWKEMRKIRKELESKK